MYFDLLSINFYEWENVRNINVENAQVRHKTIMIALYEPLVTYAIKVSHLGL